MRMRRGTRIVGGPLLVTLVGCGNPLTSASAYEVPLFTMQGDLNPGADGLASPLVSVVWVDPLGVQDDIPEPTEDTRFALDGDGYVFDVFAPPPAAAVRDIPDSSGAVAGSFALGEIVLYDDLDGDRKFRVTPMADGSEIVPPDVYRGALAGYVLIYLEKPWSAKTEPPELHGWITTTKGYHLSSIDCSTPDVPETHITENANVGVEITVLPEGTSALPYLRDCLRTHPVASSSGS